MWGPGAVRKVLGGIAAAILLLLVVPTSGALASLTRGPFTRAFTDDIYFYPGSSWVRRTQATGAKLVLLEVDWRSIEPVAPTGSSDGTNPSGREYGFGYLDDVVRKFVGTGMSPAFLITDAPTWAEARGGPANLEARGAWRPSAQPLGGLGAALARRYSGHYPDPLHRQRMLPRVRYFQLWAEANFTIHLAPQWTRSGGGWAPAAPAIYRQMLNAFYAGVHRQVPSDVVVATGLGPYGDSPGGCANQTLGNGCRTPPVAFLRSLLCLDRSLRRLSCRTPAHFDVVAADPYEVAGPTTGAVNQDDASVPDLGKLTRVVNRAVTAASLLPRAHKSLWVTEFSYDSNPPNPYAPSAATQARWLEQALYEFWHEGVSTAVWYLVRDQAGNDWTNSYFSGVYFRDGRAKPSFTAFRFPFVVMAGGSSTEVWGIAPRSGRVSVQGRRGSRWRTLTTLDVRNGSVFDLHLSGTRHGSFRAVSGRQSSLVWSG